MRMGKIFHTYFHPYVRVKIISDSPEIKDDATYLNIASFRYNRHCENFD